MNHDAKKPPSRILIAAVDAASGIAKDGNMPWNLPEDMSHFRTMTMGNPVIMGRKTYDTIGHPLSGRLTIVISRDPFFRNDATGKLDRWISSGALVIVDSIEAAFETVKDEPVVYIAGGLSIYEQAIKYCDEMIITTIKKDFDCDQVLVVQMDKWRVSSWKSGHSEKADLDYIITSFERMAPDDEPKKELDEHTENESGRSSLEGKQ